jgi:hypothetical protein
MKTFLVGGLRLWLRLFGAFWIFGGILTFQAARESLFMDQILDALNPKKEDRLLSYFLLLSSFLTICTGGALLLARAWALLPLGILIASQIVYFAIQKYRFNNARTEIDRDMAKVNPATINAFKVCWGVAIAAGLGGRMGALK